MRINNDNEHEEEMENSNKNTDMHVHMLLQTVNVRSKATGHALDAYSRLNEK